MNQLSLKVLNLIVSTKFRKSALDVSVRNAFHDYIEKCMKREEPLTLYLMVGGYKQARLYSAPFPDWAEVFNIHFILQLAASIEAIYPPGVHLIYRTHEVLMGLLNNYSEAMLHTYHKSFQQLIDIFSESIPEKRAITLSQTKSSELASLDYLLPLMEKKYHKRVGEFNMLPYEQQEQYIEKSMRNQCWNGEEDLQTMSDSKRKEKAKWAYIMDQLFLETDPITSTIFPTEYIPIYFVKNPLKTRLHYGSCSASNVQFWAGNGFLEKRNSRFIPTILSHNQQSQTSHTKVDLVNNPFQNVVGNIIGILN